MHQIVQWGGPGANPQQFTPNVLALDAQDDVYVMDLGYAQIEKYTLQGKLLAIWHPRGLGSTPNLKEFDLTVGRDGSIYVMFSSAISLAIEKLAPSGREIARWGALGPHGEVSNNLASLQFGDGADGFAATVDGRLLKVDQSLHVLDAWSLQQLRTPLFRAPSAIAADGNGHAYVADPAARQMVELSTASDSVTRWSASIASRSPNPLVAAMAVDPHGNLVVLDASGTKFNTYSSVGRLVRSSRYGGASTGTSAPYTAMGVDGTGNVSALADAGSVVRTFTPSGQLVHSWCANCDVSAPFNLAAAMTESAAGNVYVSYQFEVVEYSPTGLPIHSWTAKGMPATGLAVDPHGNLYVTGLGRNALEILSPSGRVLATWTRLGPHGPAFTDPGAVTVDRQGNIYLVDGQRVLELAPLKPGR
jgi:sugar lactone lactonase YvrE